MGHISLFPAFLFYTVYASDMLYSSMLVITDVARLK